MTPLMSFWPSIYEKIKCQEKIIEYRRRFPVECTAAYMYISKPTKAICGIIYFGKIHAISDWQEEYKDNIEITRRITDFDKSYGYGAEIIGFQEISPITLSELRKNVPNFVAPQSYLLLENNRVLKDYVESNTILIGERIENDMSNIFPDHICKRY